MTRGQLALLTVLGALLRLPLALGRPLWLDEAITARFAVHVDPWQVAAQMDMHPPAYAALVRALHAVLPGDAAVRAPALLAGVALVPVAAWAGRAWAGPEGARRAALVAAVLPPWVIAAGDGRPWSLALLACVGLLGALGHDRRLAPWSLLAVATAWSTWPVVLAAHAVRTARHPRDAARWLDGLPVVLLAGWLATTLLPAQLAHQGQGLSTGPLAAWFWTPTDALAHAAAAVPAVLGYASTGLGPRGAWWAGLPLLAAVVHVAPRVPRALGAVLALSVAVVWAAAGLGLHPLGPTRHVLPLTAPLVFAVVAATRETSWRGLAPWLLLPLVGLVRAPRPPTQQVAALAARLDGPVVLDASAAPQGSWYGVDAVAVATPWRVPARIGRSLGEVPPQSFWLVATRDLEAGLVVWAEGSGRRIVAREHDEGVDAWKIGPR